MVEFCALTTPLTTPFKVLTTPHLVHVDMATPAEKERIAKLESRSREAESALQQLSGYVELLKKKAGQYELHSSHFDHRLFHIYALTHR